MNTQKTFFVIILLVNPMLINATTETNSIEKNYPLKVPSIIDGTPIGLNGYEIKKIIFTIREIEKMIHGTLNPLTKQHKGKYSFQGRLYTVKELMTLEKNIHTSSTNIQTEFIRLLESVKEDFITTNEPYLEQIQTIKSIALKFMMEWALNHNREDCYMLSWAKEKNGHEFEALRKNITSFEKHYLFCNDLVSFLSDFATSCPRAWQQFIELQGKKPR